MPEWFGVTTAWIGKLHVCDIKPSPLSTCHEFQVNTMISLICIEYRMFLGYVHTVHVTYWHIIAVLHFVYSLVYFVYIIVTSFLFFPTILYISLTLFVSTCITVVFAVSGWMLNSILLYWYCVCSDKERKQSVNELIRRSKQY